MKEPEPKGLSVMQLVDVLNQHGFKNVAELAKMPPNPLLWTKRQWLFVVSIVAKGLGSSEAKVKRTFTTAGQLLKVFNEILRKTSLTIELQQIGNAQTDLSAVFSGPKWDVEWVNRDIGKKHE